VTRLRDAVVVGGGPVGLAFATAAAQRGLDVTVLERASPPVDKACGEGILPGGVRALERLGVLPHLARADAARLLAIRWIEPDGAGASLALPPPGGLGVRRTALSTALLARARAAGAEVLDRVEVTSHWRERDRIWAGWRGGALPARVLVAADGLASPTRRREGLDRPARGRPRFGVRRHFAIPPWGDEVEVHFGPGAEAYVTPAGAGRVGVAVLFGRGEGSPGFEELLARFPRLASRLAAAEAETSARGAGPLARSAAARTAERLVLLGDAAGYLDAVTGEGLSLGFGCALDLAEVLPASIAAGATAPSLQGYERAWARRWRPYAAWTRLVLGLAHHPALRRRILGLAAARPSPFERLVAAAVG
jgi:flavin-dependent dehydrogenase